MCFMFLDGDIKTAVHKWYITKDKIWKHKTRCIPPCVTQKLLHWIGKQPTSLKSNFTSTLHKLLETLHHGLIKNHSRWFFVWIRWEMGHFFSVSPQQLVSNKEEPGLNNFPSKKHLQNILLKKYQHPKHHIGHFWAICSETHGATTKSVEVTQDNIWWYFPTTLLPFKNGILEEHLKCAHGKKENNNNEQIDWGPWTTPFRLRFCSSFSVLERSSNSCRVFWSSPTTAGMGTRQAGPPNQQKGGPEGCTKWFPNPSTGWP